MANTASSLSSLLSTVSYWSDIGNCTILGLSYVGDATYSRRTSALSSILLLERSSDVRNSRRTASATILL